MEQNRPDSELVHKTMFYLGEEDSETLSEPSAKRMKIQEGEEETPEAGQEKEQEEGQEAANGEAEEGEKRAENGDAAVEENGEVAKKNEEEQQESEEEEKENESSEKVKNGTKENGRKTEAAPSETKTGKFLKSILIVISNVIRYRQTPVV
jgi:hypothetical protein